MTGYFTPVRKAVKKITPKEVYAAEASHYLTPAFKPEMPEVPETPGAPTIDDAVKSRQDQDRLRRRRGVLANIYGGAGASAPSVGVKTLLGS